MQGVCAGIITAGNWRKRGDGVTYSDWRVAMSWFGKVDRPEARSQQNQALSLLRNAIINTGDLIPFHVIPCALKRCDKLYPNWANCKTNYILHRHDLGQRFYSQPLEALEQLPSGIGRFTALRIGGEGLTRCTSGKNANLGLAKPAPKIGGSDICNVTLEKLGAAIFLDWETAARV